MFLLSVKDPLYHNINHQLSSRRVTTPDHYGFCALGCLQQDSGLRAAAGSRPARPYYRPLGSALLSPALDPETLKTLLTPFPALPTVVVCPVIEFGAGNGGGGDKTFEDKLSKSWGPT